MKPLKKIARAVIVLSAVCSLASCYKEDPVTYRESIDGLWVSSGYDLTADKQTMYLVEISNASANFRTVILGKGFSSVSNDKEQTASVTYSSDRGKGRLTLEDGSFYDFGLSRDGHMMFVRKDDAVITLACYDTTADAMIGNMKKSLTSKFKVPDGFVGPTSYVELDWEEPALLGNVAAPPVPAEGILDWVAKGLVTGIASTSAKLIIESFVEDETSKKLDEILAGVDNLNKHLAELINLVHNTTYEHYLNERTNSYLNPMRNLSKEYILRVVEAWINGDDPAPIVMEWANRTVGGNPAYIEARNFIDYLTGTVVERKNLYQVYDLYVFNTYPWENLGYSFRENLRAADICVIAQSILLTKLYYIYSDFSESTKKSLSDELTACFDDFKKFVEANAVERHDDQAICQIKDAHFIMPVALVNRDFKNHPWFPDKTPWDFENSESAWWLVNGDTKYNCAELYRSCISEDELNALTSYYKDSPYTSILDVLTQEANCTLPYSDSNMAGKKIILQTQTSGSNESQSMTNNNYYIYANTVIEAAKGFKPEKKTIGIAWLERHGFLWMEQWFRQWDTYYSDQLWVRTDITSRY